MERIFVYLKNHEYLSTWLQGIAALIGILSAAYGLFRFIGNRNKKEKDRIEIRRKEIKAIWVDTGGNVSRTDKYFEVNLKNEGTRIHYDKIEYNKNIGITSSEPKKNTIIDKNKELRFKFHVSQMDSANYPVFSFDIYYNDEDLNRYKFSINTSPSGIEIGIPEYIQIN